MLILLYCILWKVLYVSSPTRHMYSFTNRSLACVIQKSHYSFLFFFPAVTLDVLDSDIAWDPLFEIYLLTRLIACSCNLHATLKSRLFSWSNNCQLSAIFSRLPWSLSYILLLYLCSIHGEVQLGIWLIWRLWGLVESLPYFRYCKSKSNSLDILIILSSGNSYFSFT